MQLIINRIKQCRTMQFENVLIPMGTPLHFLFHTSTMSLRLPPVRLSGDSIPISISCERLEPFRLLRNLIFISFISEKLISMNAVEMGTDNTINCSSFSCHFLSLLEYLAITDRIFPLRSDIGEDKCISYHHFAMQHRYKSL